MDEVEVPEVRLTAWDILGINPQATGDLSTGEFIDRMRRNTDGK